MATIIETNDQRRSAAIKLALPIIVFLCALIGTAVLDISSWGDEKRRTVLAWPEEAGLSEALNGDLAKATDRMLLDASTVRRWATVAWSQCLYRGIGHLVGGVVEGQSGWLFLNARLKREPFMDAPRMRQFAALTGQLTHRMAERGCELSVLLLPRKGLIATEMLGELSLQGAGDYWQLIRAFREAGVAAPSLAEELLMHPPSSTWYRFDTHFTMNGSEVVSDTFTRSLGLQVEPPQRPLRFQRKSVKYLEGVDLLHTAGIQSRFVDIPFPGLKKVDPAPVFFMIREGEARFFNPAEQKGSRIARQWLAGTSFSTVNGGMLPLFLEHHTGEPVRNLAIAGGGPFAALDRAIQRAKRTKAWPERCFWELPSFLLLSYFKNGQRPHEGLLAITCRLPRKQSHPLASLALGGSSPQTPLRRSERASFEGAVAARDVAVADGSGSLHFRLKRRPGTGDLRVRLSGSLLGASVNWPAGDPVLDLPLCAPHPTAFHQVEVSRVGAGLSANVASLSLCAERPVPSAEGWHAFEAAARAMGLPSTTTALISDSALLNPSSTLFLRRKPGQTGPHSPPFPRILRIAARTADGTKVLLWQSLGQALEPGRLTVVSAGRARGLRLQQLEFDCEDPGPDLTSFEFALVP